MQLAFLIAEAIDDPRQEYLDMDRQITKISLKVPAVGKNKADTLIEYHSYRNDLGFKRGDIVQVMGAQVRHDYKTREWWMTGGFIEVRTPPCKPMNYLIFAGRCMSDLDATNPRDFRVNESFMTANSAISVSAGKESDVIPFTAINGSDDRYKLAQLMADMACRKGKGLTIMGKLVTDTWKNKETGEPVYKTYIKLAKITMAPKTKSDQEIKPRAEIPEGAEPKSLWLPAEDDDNDPF